MKPTNNYEALCLALYLSATASTDKKADECLAMAKEFANKLSEIEVERAKREIEVKLSKENL